MAREPDDTDLYEKRAKHLTAVGIVLLVVLSCSYIVAYVATVERVCFMATMASPDIVPERARPEYHIFGGLYSTGSIPTFFYPVHWLDRQLRPQYWLLVEE